MDAPEHARYRELVSAAFTRRQVALIDEQIRSAAREIVDGLVGAGDIDFVDDCAALLPMRTIADMMGVPESERLAAARAGTPSSAGPIRRSATRPIRSAPSAGPATTCTCSVPSWPSTAGCTRVTTC